ncbi:hypothetical protein PHYPSEUDO_015564 [Phytophthora pseudosyringae]|uniref:Uncharacterized protein n=1 Tax=Phytophthora pseudosyringae TaxID=221518 RepID=A0A8T1V6K2_9STRA|nr:hypothetical protein PHYPSEUDO_015564 [Phytophthora pseudosyringae]
MATELDHVEVAPRMWDKTIAAPYNGRSSSRPAAPVKDAAAVATPMQPDRASNDSGQLQSPQASLAQQSRSCPISFFAQWKSVIIPALLIIAILMATYVLWKYYTKYRQSKKTAQELLQRSAKAPAPQPASPLDIVKSVDTAKYEYDSDNEAEEEEENKDHKQHVKPKVHFQQMQDDVANTHGNEEGENDDDDDEEETADDDEEDEDEDVEEVGIGSTEEERTSLDGNSDEDDSEEEPQGRSMPFFDFPNRFSIIDEPSAPDFKKIEELIRDSSVPMLEPTAYISDIDETSPKTSRKSRKPKRVTL